MDVNERNKIADHLYEQCASDEFIDSIMLAMKSLYKIPNLGTDGVVKLRLAVYITHIFGCEYACLVRYGNTLFVEGLFSRFKELIHLNTVHIPEMRELVLEVLQEYHRRAVGKNFREISEIVSKSYSEFLGVDDSSRQLTLAASNVFITIVEKMDRHITDIGRSR